MVLLSEARGEVGACDHVEVYLGWPGDSFFPQYELTSQRPELSVTPDFTSLTAMRDAYRHVVVDRTAVHGAVSNLQYVSLTLGIWTRCAPFQLGAPLR